VPAVPALLVDRPGAVQTTVRMGGAAPLRSDPDYPAAKLANLVFGGYFSSRLVANIRERRGYTYSPRSAIEHGVAGSLLTVAADVATEVTAPALLEISYELGRIASLPVEPEELEAARRYAVGSLALSTATGAGLASTLAALLSAGLDLTYLRDHPRALVTVTADDVLAAARALLGPATLVTVLVGDAERIAPQVAALAPVQQA
jgi:predicted Zn-dependent peptidase